MMIIVVLITISRLGCAWTGIAAFSALPYKKTPAAMCVALAFSFCGFNTKGGLNPR